MSSDTAKKRKVAAEEYDCGSDNNTAGAGVEDIIAEMKAHMMSMQNEMNSMRERLSNVEKLESKAASMQNEIDELKITTNGLKKENKFLKTKCSSLEISVSILVKEQKWEYSAPDIPTSHWHNPHFDEEYIEEMESFLDDIKSATVDLRKNGIVII